MNIQKWLKNNTHDLTSKTIAITGSTGGLGKELALVFSKLNANLIFLDRNTAKSEQLKNSIIAQYPNAKIEMIKLDLADFESVKHATEILKHKKIDILIHNAGIYNVPRQKTSIGHDNIFQVNFLAPYYLTKQLISSNEALTKVVVVSSIAHNYSQIDENDIEFSSRIKSSKIYGNSKRYLTYSLMSLFQNQTKSKLSIAHPGITLTNMTNHYPKAINWLVKLGIKLFFPSPKVATLSIVKAVFEDCMENEWIGPRMFNIWGKPKKQFLKTATQEEKEKIFQIAEDLYAKLINNS